MNKSAISWNLSNEILLELSISGSSFGTISHPGYDEIGWIETVFCKYVIILNILTISFFSDRLEGTKERSCCFFNHFWSLVDLSVGFEPRWSSDHLSEKKERTDLVGFPRNSSISSGSRWLIICFSRSVNSRDIEEYPERLFGNRSDSISVRSVWRKEGSQRIDLSFSCWISLWLINVWYSESSLLMESKGSLDWSEDPFNWLESLFFPIQFLHHREPQLDSGMLHFLVIGRTQVLSFGFRKQLSEIFFPFGRYRRETINLLILEDPTDSSNVAFLGPMEFIGIGRSPIK